MLQVNRKRSESVLTLVVESTVDWRPFSFKYLKDIADLMAGMS